MCELSQNYMFKTLLTCRQIRMITKWKPCSASNPVYSNRVRLTARNCSSFSFCKFCNTARNKQQKMKSFCAYLGISTELILHLGAWCTVSQLCRTTVWRRRVAVVFSTNSRRFSRSSTWCKARRVRRDRGSLPERSHGPSWQHHTAASDRPRNRLVVRRNHPAVINKPIGYQLLNSVVLPWTIMYSL